MQKKWLVVCMSVVLFVSTQNASAATLLTTYNTTSTPAIDSDFTFRVTQDATSGAIYVLTNSGVNIIDTQGTISPSDDIVAGAYDSTFLHGVPMTGSTMSPLFFDDVSNLLYVGTNNGLAVVDTAGTITGTDDTLVVNYTNVDGFGGGSTSDPLGLGIFARMDAQVDDIAIDTANGIIYVGFYSGNTSVVAINTHGTLSTSDDTIQNYGDSSPNGPSF